MPATYEAVLAAETDELKDDDNTKVALVDPCYEYQTMGFHLKNMDTMVTRFYRQANNFASELPVTVPTHFLCQHCALRHKIDVKEVNEQIFTDPDPRRKSLHYNHLILGILAKNPDGAAEAGVDYKNGFTHDTDTEFWDLVNPPAPPPAKKTTSSSSSSSTTTATS